MALFHQDIADIDLESGSIHRSFLNHSIGTADSAANRFGVRVFRKGNPVDLSGVSCQGFFRNSRGENIALTSYGTVSGNVAFVTLPQACYNYSGNFTLSIKLVGSGVTGTMRIVDGVVDNTNTSGAVAPTGSVPTYQEILSVYDEMVDMIADYNHGENNTAAQIEQIKGNLTLQDPEYALYWEQGSIASDGTELDDPINRIRSGFIYLRDLESLALSCDSGYSYSYILYDSSKSASYASQWTTADNSVSFDPGTFYVRIVLRNTSDTPIDTTEGYHFHALPDSVIKSAYESLNSSIGDINNDITTLQSDIGGLQSDIADANLEITALQVSGNRNAENIDANAAALEKVQRELSQSVISTPMAWVQGGISSTGEETSANNRIRSSFLFMADQIKISVSCASGYQVAIYTYDSNKENPDAGSWKTNDVIDFAPGAAYVRFALRKTTDAGIVPDEGTALTVTLYPKIQDTLSSYGTRITALENAVDGMFSVSGNTLVIAN